MGIVPLQKGQAFVIASDCDPNERPSNRAPKRMTSASHFWSGSAWSTSVDAAQTFASAEDVDEYVKTHYAQLTSQQRNASSR